MKPPSSSEARPSTPRWVKVFALVAALVVVLFVVLLLLGAHGPSRHGAARQAPLAAHGLP